MFMLSKPAVVAELRYGELDKSTALKFAAENLETGLKK